MTSPLHARCPVCRRGHDRAQDRGPDVYWTICRARRADALPADALADADGIVVWQEMRIDLEFLAKVPRCRVIVRAGVGFDHIDLEAAGRAGIPVCNTPDYGTSEVADHAIALMLALTRDIVAMRPAGRNLRRRAGRRAKAISGRVFLRLKRQSEMRTRNIWRHRPRWRRPIQKRSRWNSSARKRRSTPSARTSKR